MSQCRTRASVTWAGTHWAFGRAKPFEPIWAVGETAKQKTRKNRRLLLRRNPRVLSVGNQLLPNW
jgi:hypothetical protein